MNKNFIDLTGKRFGILSVIRRDIERDSQTAFWICKCDCGKEISVLSYRLRKKNKINCGCIFRPTKSYTQLGLCKTKEYTVWRMMMVRCYKPYNKNYPGYGARGIKVCERWNDFKNFISDMGLIPKGKSLERIDNDGNYCPENCRWATTKEQSNNRRSSRIMEAFGKAQTLQQWADEYNINSTTLADRIDKYNWSFEDALTKPVKKGLITAFGKSKTARQWSLETGIKESSIKRRIYDGLTHEEAVSKPAQKYIKTDLWKKVRGSVNDSLS